MISGISCLIARNNPSLSLRSATVYVPTLSGCHVNSAVSRTDAVEIDIVQYKKIDGVLFQIMLICEEWSKCIDYAGFLSAGDPPDS